MKKLIFFDIDTQNDFMLPEGKLYVKGAETIIPKLQMLFNFARVNNIPIVSSADAHKENDEEFTQFPPHCVKGTKGQRKIGATTLTLTVTIPNKKTNINIEQGTQIVIEKETFDVFSNPNTVNILKKIRPKNVIVFGVATDYCVKSVVLSLLKKGYKVIVVEDAIKAVSPETEKSVIDEMKKNGAKFVSTKDIVSESIF